MWDPQQYARFADQRSRPFFELTARIRAESPRLVYDLGCGSGELTATLAERWPAAQVVGVDSSPSMLAAAAAHGSDRLRLEAGDLRTFLPPADADVVVSNAAYHWVDNHVAMLRRIAERLPSPGWLAIQVPGNFAAPSHVLIRELARSAGWRTRLTDAGVGEDPVLDAAGYGALFAAAGLEVDTWETTYNQVLTGDDPVLDWLRGTTLRPVLELLDPDERGEFLADLAPRLRAAYPAGAAGTVFPFRRIFAVAWR